jgi:predicted RNase H-like HicB family nuclease
MPDPVVIVSRLLTTAEVDVEIDDILTRPYSYVFTPDETVGGFAASILEFTGCFAQGRTVEAAFENVRSAARVWLRIVLQQGQSVPPPLDPSTRIVPLEFPHDLHSVVQRAAAAEGLSASELVLRFISERLGAPRVHVTFEGRALCGKADPPGTWTDGDRHVRITDAESATCEACITRVPSFLKLL